MRAAFQRWAVCVLLWAAAAILANTAHAAPSVRVHAAPLFGTDSPAGGGWSSVVVRIENTGREPVAGIVELQASVYGSRSQLQTTRAPFSLTAGGATTLELPSHEQMGFPSTRKTVAVLDGSGTTLQEVSVPAQHASEPFLLDLRVPSPLGAALRGTSIPVSDAGSMYPTTAAPALSVAGPSVDTKSGDLLLPERPAGYAPVTVVLASSDVLARLPAPRLQALSDWLLSGGALAVTIARPEDLQSAPLSTLLGGPVRQTHPKAALAAPRLFLRAPETPSPDANPDPAAPPVPEVSPDPRAAPSFEYHREAPSSTTLERAAGFEGANLRDAPWGASASYGLGEVHLLAVDPRNSKLLQDPWVRLTLLDLVRHAFERYRVVALPYAKLPPDGMGMDAVRRQLDPNEAARWTIIVSALLLLAYALVAGPLNFYLAARRGRPLRALLHLPLYAVGCAAVVVVLGTLGRGFEGKVRRLTVVEAGAGMSRAAAARFRGFFAGSSDALSVWVEERGNVLDLAGDRADTAHTLVLDRRGARIEDVRSKPWQVLVVREDGFMALGGGVSMTPTANGDLRVHNRTAKDLRAVVLKLPGKLPVFIPRIKDGQSVLASSGRPVPGSFAPSYPNQAFTPLGSADLASAFEGEVSGLGAAWTAIESVANHGTDFWPGDVPVLLAQLGEADGGSHDSGLRVESDRVLLRVVGYGGAP